MLDAIKSFFGRNVTGPEPGPRAQQDPDRSLRVAACALLLELAHADDVFTEDERRHIEEALVRHFDIPVETARELMTLAEEERREAPDLFQFTSLVNAHYDEGQRMVLAEVLWGVIHADGTLSKHEDHVVRRIGRLLELRPGYLAQARKRVQGEGGP